MKPLDSVHHVAIPVKEVAEAVEWYTRTFQCTVKYQDESWALLDFENIQMALVIPEQHPAHIGFVSGTAEHFGHLKTHRDGTRSCYVKDPAGNPVEIMAADSVTPQPQ